MYVHFVFVVVDKIINHMSSSLQTHIIYFGCCLLLLLPAAAACCCLLQGLVQVKQVL